MKKLIYVAGPYCGNDGNIVKNTEYARKKAIKIFNIGASTICPHLNTFGFEKVGMTEEHRIACEDRIIQGCDAIFMMPNWKVSKGSIREREFALNNDITVLYTLEEVKDFVNKKHKRCYLSGTIRTRYIDVDGNKVSKLLEDRVDNIRETYYSKRMEGMFPVPKL